MVGNYEGDEANVDYGRAREFLETFAELARAANERQKQVDEYWRDQRWVAIDLDLQGRLHAVQTIASQLDPNLDPIGPDRGMYSTVWDDAYQIVHRAIGVINHAEELSSIVLGGGPALDSEKLHPWVWSVASPIWSTGMYRHAVQTAGANVDNMTKAKLRRTDVSGVKLAGEAWGSTAPTPGRPRLRPEGFGSPGDESYESALAGARELHMGAMRRIRNLATHEIEELNEQIALEQLATLSFVARLIDEALLLEPDE